MVTSERRSTSFEGAKACRKIRFKQKLWWGILSTSLVEGPGKRHPLVADGDDSLNMGSRFWPRSAAPRRKQGKVAILGGAAGGFFCEGGVKMVISLYKKRGGRAEIHSESILQRSAASCDAFASSAFLLSLSLAGLWLL